jgi:uncharacterized protein YegL
MARAHIHGKRAWPSAGAAAPATLAAKGCAMTLDQMPFDTTEFASNPEPRCPCLLLLDRSTSMRGRAIAELNAGLQSFRAELMADAMAMQRVELGIVTFGPVRVEADFRTPDNFAPPALVADGDTPIGGAILRGLDMLDARKRIYREAGISYFRPWVFMITDGAPTDAWQGAADRVRAGDSDRGAFSFFAVGVEGADMATLARICSPARPPMPLRGLRFRELFSWLSNSLGGVAKSRPGQKVNLPVPAGWASV